MERKCQGLWKKIQAYFDHKSYILSFIFNSEFQREAGKTGGGPPPPEPPVLPGDLAVPGDLPNTFPGAVQPPPPQDRPLPSSYPGAGAPPLPPKRPPPSTFPGAPGLSVGCASTTQQEYHPILYDFWNIIHITFKCNGVTIQNWLWLSIDTMHFWLIFSLDFSSFLLCKSMYLKATTSFQIWKLTFGCVILVASPNPQNQYRIWPPPGHHCKSLDTLLWETPAGTAHLI